MKQHFVGFCVAIITLAVGCGFELFSSYSVGELEARIDLLQGNRIYKRCVPSSPREEESSQFVRVMLDDYNVEVLPEESCPDSLSHWERRDGYNAVQVAELEKIYGKGVVEKAWRRVSDWERNQTRRRLNQW